MKKRFNEAQIIGVLQKQEAGAKMSELCCRHIILRQPKACLPDWCAMRIKDRDGWIRKSDIWGVTREEVFHK